MPRAKAQPRRLTSGPPRQLDASKRAGTRAPNAFFVYRTEQWAKLKDEPGCSSMQQPEFLKMIATKWKEIRLDPISYAGYQEKARRERERRDRMLCGVENERRVESVPFFPQEDGVVSEDAPSNFQANQGNGEVPYDPATIEICGDAQLLSALIKACEIFESFVYE